MNILIVEAKIQTNNPSSEHSSASSAMSKFSPPIFHHDCAKIPIANLKNVHIRSQPLCIHWNQDRDGHIVVLELLALNTESKVFGLGPDVIFPGTPV